MSKTKINIPYGKHSIDKTDINSVVKVLKSNFLTQGKKVSEFENIISNFCKSKFAVAVNSATSGLHLACLSLGLKKNDYVWTSSITFVASANCALLCDAKVDFIDINPKTYNMCTKDLERKLIIAEKKNKLPKIVIPVHLSGQPCELIKIFQLSKKFGFKIIEDASHAIGSKYRNQNIGSCQYSDATIFSFHPVKIITTGEGGMITTNKKGIYQKLISLRSHGIDKSIINKNKKKIINYDQKNLGLNYRMNDIEAALGISQFKKINLFIKKRRDIVLKYNKKLSKYPLTLPYELENTFSSYHLYIIRMKNIDSEYFQKKLYDFLVSKKINVNLHYIPVYEHSYFKKLGFKKNYCFEAEKYFKEAISLPIFPSMTNNQFKYIISCFDKFFK